MRSTDENKKALALALKYLGHCPLCNTKYPPAGASFFEKSETAHLLHLKCPKCQANFLAAIFFLGQGVSTVGALTDLNFNDIKRVYKAEAISLDEVLSAHEWLNSKNFNFKY